MIKQIHSLFFEASSNTNTHKTYRKSLIIVGFLMITSSTLALIPPSLLGDILNSIAAKEMQNIYIPLAGFVCISIVLAMLIPLQAQCIMKWTMSLLRDRSIDSAQKIIENQPFSFFAKTHTGKLIQIHQRGMGAYGMMLHHSTHFIIPNSIKMLIILAYISYQGGLLMSCILLACGITTFFALRFAIHLSKPFIENKNQAENALAGSLGEAFRAGKTFKLLPSINAAVHYLQKHHKHYAQKKVQLSLATEGITSLQQFAITGGSALIIFTAIHLSETGDHMSSGAFLALFLYAFAFMDATGKVTHGLKELAILSQDKKHLDALLKQNLKSHPNTQHHTQTLPKTPSVTILPFEIPLSDTDTQDSLEPGTANNQKTTLQNSQTITIPYGTKVAISGSTGQGKTTLAKMIANMICKKNTIRFADIDVGEIPQIDIRNTVFLGEHKPEFFSASLLPSLALPVAFHPTQQKLEELLGALQLEKYIPLIDDSTQDVPVKSLSSGEKKRFGLLRAMLLNRPITILDEPTEALNSELAKSIWQLIFAHFSQSTLICLTHDTAALETFDQVIHIQDHSLHLRVPQKPSPT